MEIRDPVLGFIHPRDRELDIINAPVMQRLRRIRQLAMAHLLYPGATHTRFEHSLGVFHIASRMADKIPHLATNKDKSQLVRFAALLHDIGHGPFSHVSDVIFERFGRDTLPPGEAKPHEKIAVKLLQFDKHLSRLLSEDERVGITSLLSGVNPPMTVMREILCSGVEADRMDYLLRDSHFCGVKYGAFDMDRMLDSLTSYEERNDVHIAIKHDGVHSIEQFVLARYFMTTQVYAHRVRSICDEMIARGVEIGLDEGVDFLCRLYQYEETEDYLHNYLQWHDSRIIDTILESGGQGKCAELFRRLHERRLFKMVFQMNMMEFVGIGGPFRDKLSGISSAEEVKLRRDLERHISSLPQLRCPPEHVIVTCRTKASPEMMVRKSEGELRVIRRDSSSKPFREESAVFASISESLKDQCVEVYAPFEHGGRDREELKRQLDKAILELLQDKGREYED